MSSYFLTYEQRTQGCDYMQGLWVGGCIGCVWIESKSTGWEQINCSGFNILVDRVLSFHLYLSSSKLFIFLNYCNSFESSLFSLIIRIIKKIKIKNWMRKTLKFHTNFFLTNDNIYTKRVRRIKPKNLCLF